MLIIITLLFTLSILKKNTNATINSDNGVIFIFNNGDSAKAFISINNGNNTIAIINNDNGFSIIATTDNGNNNASTVIDNSVSITTIIDNIKNRRYYTHY